MMLASVLALDAIVVSARAPIPYANLTQAIDRLLASYGKLRGIGNAAAVRQKLSTTPDRLNVVEAVALAGFIPLTPRTGKPIPANARLIDYIQEVTGIWGVRIADHQGKYQFRLSVTLTKATTGILDASNEFDHSGMSCHVLLPAGDDGSSPPQDGGPADCFRKRDYPSTQVSFLTANPTVGEIDIDFDPKELINLSKCHNSPSNSDPRAVKDSFDDHMKELNKEFSYFDSPLTFACNIKRFHCKASYADTKCP